MALCFLFAAAVLGIPTFFCIVGLAHCGLDDAAPGITLTVSLILCLFLTDWLYRRFDVKR